MFDPKTGKVLEQLDRLNGDIRCNIVYDKETDAYYFTSKGGSFYSFKVQKSENEWNITNLWELKLENGSESAPMSTCSPVIYNKRAYIGVSGSSQFGDYSGHYIGVIDIQTKKWYIKP